MRRHPLQIRPNRRLVPFQLHALVAILYLVPPLGVSGADLPEPRIPVVLKVDDISSKPDGSVSARWKRIIDFALERKIKVSIGVIANSLEGDKPAYLAYLKQVQESGLIELWFHGYDQAALLDLL